MRTEKKLDDDGLEDIETILLNDEEAMERGNEPVVLDLDEEDETGGSATEQK
jgi:hypothetical protein